MHIKERHRWHASAQAGTGILLASVHEVANRLRPLLRRTDVVEVDPGTGIGILLFDADADGADIVQHRIVRELNTDAAPRQAPARALETLQLALGSASAGPTEMPQLPAVVRDLVCVACTPHQWVSVPVARAPGRAGTRMRSRRSLGSTHSGRAAPRHQLGMAPVVAPLAEHHELRCRADELGVPFVTVPTQLSDGLRRVVKLDLARELCAVPIGRTRGALTVAMRDPTDMLAMQRLAAATGLTIFPVLAAPSDLSRALAHLAQERPRGRRLACHADA
jgi:hypothetical protein